MSLQHRQDGNDVDIKPHHSHLPPRLPPRLSPRSSHRPSTAEEPISSSGWNASSSAIIGSKREDAPENEEDGRVRDRRASPVPRSHLHPSLSHPSLSRPTTDNTFANPQSQSRHSSSHSRRAHPYPRPRDRQRRSDSRSNHSSQSDSYARLSISESSFSGDELEFDDLDNQDSDWRAESESLLHPHSPYPPHHPQTYHGTGTGTGTGRDSRNSRNRKADLNPIHAIGRTQSLHSLRSGRSGYSNYTNYPVHSPPPPSQLSSPYLDSSLSGPDRGRMRTHPRQSNMDDRDMDVDVDVDMDELHSDEEYDKRRQSVQSVQSLRSIGGISTVSTDDGSYGGESNSLSPPPTSSPAFTFVTHAHSTPSSHSHSEHSAHGSDAGSHRGSHYGGNSGVHAGISNNPRAGGEGNSPGGSGSNGSATAPLSLDSLPSYPADQKPPFSYPVLIRLAILGSPQKRLLLSQIYSAIEEKFPWYRDSAPKAWKASVRHCLSLNKEFVRMQRAVEDPGVGCGGWWSVGEGMKGLKRPRKRRPPHAKREEQERSMIEQQQIAMGMGMPHGSPSHHDIKIKSSDYSYNNLSDMEPQSPGGAAIRRRHTVQVRTDPYPVFIAPAPAAGPSSSAAMMGVGAAVAGPSSSSAPGSAVASGFGHAVRGVERESPYMSHRDPMYPPRIPSPQYQARSDSRYQHPERRSGDYAPGHAHRERDEYRHPRYHHAPHSSSDSSVGVGLAREFRDHSISNIDYSLRLPPLQIPNMENSAPGQASAHSNSQSRSQVPNANSSSGPEKRSNLMSISSLISGAGAANHNHSPSPPSSSLTVNANSNLNSSTTPTWRTANLKTDPLSLLASASVGDLDIEMYTRERQQAQAQALAQYQQPSLRRSLEGDRSRPTSASASASSGYPSTSNFTSSSSTDANTTVKKRREKKPKEEDTPFSSEQTIRPMSTPTPSPPASPVTGRNSRDGAPVGFGVGVMEGRDVDIRSRRSRVDVESESE